MSRNFKWLVVLGSIVVICLVIAILWIPKNATKSLDSLYALGKYEILREEALTILAIDPDSAEAREYLVRVELALGNELSAMEHMLILKDSGKSIAVMEKEFAQRLDSIVGNHDLSISLLDIVEHGLINHPSWNWGRDFGLKILVESGIYSRVPDYLKSFSSANLERSIILVNQAWELVISSDLGVAWLTAVILDDLQPNIHLQYSYSHQLFLVEGNYGSKDDWLGLQESFPENVLIAIGLAQSMLPSEGLDFLVGWHNSHGVSDELVYYYTSALQNLIVKADNVSLFHLENIRTDYLIDSAIQDATNKSKLSTILDYLEQRPEFMAEFKDELPIFRVALEAPAPSWYFSDSQADGLSPDGEWVRFINIDGSANIKYYNLETGAEFILPSTPHHWSPEYTDIVFQDSHLIKIFNLQSGQVQEYQIRDGVLVGWKDNSHLWMSESVQTESGQKNELRVLSLNGGDITPMEGSPKIAEAFISGPGGKIAWIQEHEVGVGVFDRDQVYFFQYPYAEYEYINLFDWTPGGSGLVLTLYETLCIQRLDGSIERLSLQRSEYFASYPRFYAWRNENEFYWCYKVGYHDMLALYNISNKRTTLTGIFNVTAVAGNRALATGGDGKVYVYDLRN